MATASEIIQRCGGFKTVADWLGMDRSGVQRWVYDPPRGCGNRVPAGKWSALINKAAENGVRIGVEELMPEDLAGSVRPQKRKRAA